MGGPLRKLLFSILVLVTLAFLAYHSRNSIHLENFSWQRLWDAVSATRKSLLQTATEAIGGTADQLARVAQQDSEKYARLVKELNIKAG